MELPQSFLVNSCQSARQWVIVWFWLEKKSGHCSLIVRYDFSNLNYPPVLIRPGHCEECKNQLQRTHCIKQGDVKVRTRNTWFILSNGHNMKSRQLPWIWLNGLKIHKNNKRKMTTQYIVWIWTAHLQYEVLYFYNEIKDNNLYPWITIAIKLLACNHDTALAEIDEIVTLLYFLFFL